MLFVQQPGARVALSLKNATHSLPKKGIGYRHEKIRKHKTVADQYAERLIEQGIISPDDYKVMKRQYREALDRGEVDRIVAELGKGDDRLRDLVHLVVKSEIFLRK